MLSSKEIRNVKFSNSVGGYKKEEVDILLDKIEVDYEKYERMLAEQNNRIDELLGEIETYKSSQSSIQNVLLSAQRLADQIVEEAKQKSEQIISDAENSIVQITEREKELTAAFEHKASERKAQIEAEMEQMLASAVEKQRGIEAAANDSVERQQALYNRLKLEIAAFKSDITRRYKEHIELLSKLPDSVPMEPEEIAKILAMDFENPAAKAQDTVEDIATNGESLEEILEQEVEE